MMEDLIETSACTDFVPASVADHLNELYHGQSYSHFSAIPTNVTLNNANTLGTPVVLGIDEAGRGPVIGPMVYAVFYLPQELQHSLLATTHHFDDSKVLTPFVRTKLMRTVCSTGSDLFTSCGWAVKSLSARDISAGSFKNGGAYNLNAQAMDATIEILRGVIERGVNVQEVYVDTIGDPGVYQKKLERIFPNVRITVEKKADSLFPCVSAASVVAKVTRDVSCEVLYSKVSMEIPSDESEAIGWGSGYPSDSKCIHWLRNNINNTFGWGSECRLSWGTLKDMLEAKNKTCVGVDWPQEDNENQTLSQYFDIGAMGASRSEEAELRDWYGTPVERAFS